ncbi:MAG TPA: BNR-repeat neuraminidase N-terminal domain-containing protein, partial [Prolixibacteraceae bacterium]|nr:BNR-repeat neuraminidase N-terminal domain-containing protein [Prolixibacteraceae bacterium]
VPSSGLTYTWKQRDNPSDFTVTATRQTSINLTWDQNSESDDVLLAYSLNETFGVPVNGTAYTAGDGITGGGTVLFSGDGTSYNHTALTPNTVYFYKIWSINADTDYSNGVTGSSRTANGLPYLQAFNSSSLPNEWTSTFSILTNYGTANSYCLGKRFSSSSTAHATSPLLGSITNDTYLSFHYRIVDNLGYPDNASTLGASDSLNIEVSDDDGKTWNLIHTIDQTNHTVSAEYANPVISLGAYNGQYIKIRFRAVWGSGDYYIHIDNVLVEEGTDMSYTGSVTKQTNTNNVAIGSFDNEMICLHIITQKETSPLVVHSINFNTLGSTSAASDLLSAKVYFTTSPEFSTAVPYGDTIANPSGGFTINGSQSLSKGNNYFWLAYNITTSATAGNIVDAQCMQFVTSESGTAKVPSTTSPTGSRTIAATISGEKSVPGDYASIAEAVIALNNGSIGSGGVTINVSDGHTENITSPIVLTATGTEANPILFQKTGSGANPLVTRTDAGSISTSVLGNRGDAVIVIEGADYVTFNSINVAASDQGIEYGYYLRKVSVTNGCKNVTVKNASISMTKGTSRYVAGFCTGNSSSSSDNLVITNQNGSHDNIVFTGNTINNTFAGIYMKGSANFFDRFFTIGSAGHPNSIQNFGGNAAYETYGIY